MYGIEAEYLMTSHRIQDVLKLQLPGVTAEFFDFMVEIITDPHARARQAVDQLERRVQRMRRRGVELEQWASFPDRVQPITFTDVVADSPYYRWVYDQACRFTGHEPLDLHHVGMHLNYSCSDMSENELVHAVNWCRCMNFLFILFSANSPFQNGQSCGLLSRRSYQYPNRYDVPLWESAVAFKRWIQEQEALYRIYPGKGRCWMTVCPRLEDNDFRKPIQRIELRSLDSGTNVRFGVVHGCCKLLERIVLRARQGAPLPAQLNELQHNDREVSRLGASAWVRLNGQEFCVQQLAEQWAAGIDTLEQILTHGCAAQSSLRYCV